MHLYPPSFSLVDLHLWSLPISICLKNSGGLTSPAMERTNWEELERVNNKNNNGRGYTAG